MGHKENNAVSVESPVPTGAEEARSTKVDVSALMAEIRAKVKTELEGKKDQSLAFKPTQIDTDKVGTRRAGELLYSEELHYLNSHYAYSGQLNLDSVKTHRTSGINGFIGRVIVAVKRKVLRIIWDSLLRDYFLAERDYQAHLVRFLNDVSKYVDSRDASQFWEIIRKIDVDVGRALERIERINDDVRANAHASEERVYAALRSSVTELQTNLRTLNSDSAKHEDKLHVLDSVARGLEAIIARLPKQQFERVEGTAPNAAPAPAVLDYSYVLLENRYRGSEAEISARLAPYVNDFIKVNASSAQPVLEIGCGRGELLTLLKNASVPAYGVDLDAAMIEAARSRNVDARVENGLLHLESLAPASVSGVIAIQVVEHLRQEQLRKLFELCTQKVKRGGTIIFETINPKSLLALSSNYFRDPTHVWPLHPDMLSYQMTLCGLKVNEVRYSSEVPADFQLSTVPHQDFMTPRWIEMVDGLNRNFARLNEILYGFQDYCIVAEVQ